MKTVYVCSDTITGIYSAIYDAWKTGRPKEECGIAIRGMIETELFSTYEEVIETEHKARAVEHLIRKHLGTLAYLDLYQACLAADGKKADAVLGTMMAAREIPDSHKIMEHLGHPAVEKVFELSRSVGNEAHLLKGFIRFQELRNGVLYARFKPKTQVLTCLAPHFADRLPNENWMIYDEMHHMCVVHEAGKQWILVWDEFGGEKSRIRFSDKERMYAGLWQGFCQAIAIETRENPECQRQHLPLRFRPNMVEFAE